MSTTAAWLTIPFLVGCGTVVEETSPALVGSGAASQATASSPSLATAGSPSAAPGAAGNFSCPTRPSPPPLCDRVAKVLSSRTRRVHFDPTFRFYDRGKPVALVDAVEILVELDCDPNFATNVTAELRVGGQPAGISLEKLAPGCVIALEREGALADGAAMHVAMPYIPSDQLPASAVTFQAPPASEPAAERAGGGS